MKNADFAIDLFDVIGNITAIDAAIVTGTLKTSKFDTQMANAVDAAHLGVHHAVLFTPDGGNLAGKTFVVVDQNGIAGYQSGADLVVELATPANLGNLDENDFV